MVLITSSGRRVRPRRRGRRSAGEIGDNTGTVLVREPGRTRRAAE
jgi:hypothetical protein